MAKLLVFQNYQNVDFFIRNFVHVLNNTENRLIHSSIFNSIPENYESMFYLKSEGAFFESYEFQRFHTHLTLIDNF